MSTATATMLAGLVTAFTGMASAILAYLVKRAIGQLDEKIGALVAQDAAHDKELVELRTRLTAVEVEARTRLTTVEAEVAAIRRRLHDWVNEGVVIAPRRPPASTEGGP